MQFPRKTRQRYPHSETRGHLRAAAKSKPSAEGWKGSDVETSVLKTRPKGEKK